MIFRKSIKIMIALVVISSMLGLAPLQNKDVIKVAAIDWCPQICPKDTQAPGFLVEMIQEVFKGSEYQLKMTYYPWSRAIHNVRSGRMDALLSPAKDEAPDLFYHKDPISLQTHCFWKRKDSKWKFDGVKSLKNIRIIIYRDHPYQSLLKSYFDSTKKNDYFQLSYDEHYLKRVKKLLSLKRAEAFLFTTNSVLYDQRISKQKSLVIDKCIKEDKLWFALTPKKTKRILQVHRYLDENILKFKKTKKYNSLLKKYNISYPKVLKSID